MIINKWLHNFWVFFGIRSLKEIRAEDAKLLQEKQNKRTKELQDQSLKEASKHADIKNQVNDIIAKIGYLPEFHPLEYLREYDNDRHQNVHGYINTTGISKFTEAARFVESDCQEITKHIMPIVKVEIQNNRSDLIKLVQYYVVLTQPKRENIQRNNGEHISEHLPFPSENTRIENIKETTP
jgi:hypothetical protein